MEKTHQQLLQDFENCYHTAPTNLFFSPGRVNLIGEHTDYNGGFVFPCALSFGAYCAIRKTDDAVFRFASTNLPQKYEISVSNLSNPIEKGAWANYPLGVIAQFLKKNLSYTTGADLLFFGDVPHGAGLSSSAALEVVTAVAINQIYGFGLDRIELIKMSQAAEHEFAGVQCGIMDQFASGMGKKNHAIYLDCRTCDYELVPIEMEGYKIVITNSHSPHKLGSGTYNERVQECQSAVEEINQIKFEKIDCLGDLSEKEFRLDQDMIRSEVIRRRAKHVVSEIQRTNDAVFALREGNLSKFGELMNASHDSLRDDYEVTGTALDTLVEEARKVKGVLGSRMTGGGFGGCTVSIVADDSIEEFKKCVAEGYKKRTGVDAEFYIAEIGDGGKELHIG